MSSFAFRSSEGAILGIKSAGQGLGIAAPVVLALSACHRMALVRPRLTEFHGLDVAQANVDFAIPFLNEDLPLYVDPFLLWKSPSLQDQSLHGAMLAAFNRLGALSKRGDTDRAIRMIQQMSECEEVGLGDAAKRRASGLAPQLLRKY
jgi:pentatricopeptide repeat protein